TRREAQRQEAAAQRVVEALGVGDRALAGRHAEERGAGGLHAVRAVLVGDGHGDVAAREDVERSAGDRGLAGDEATLRDALEAVPERRRERRERTLGRGGGRAVQRELGELADGQVRRVPLELLHDLFQLAPVVLRAQLDRDVLAGGGGREAPELERSRRDRVHRDAP